MKDIVIKTLFFFLKVFGGAFIAITALMYFFQGKFVYYPSRRYVNTPEDIGLKYEEVFFNAEDGVRLCGWYVPSKDAEHTVLFSHGNAGNISGRLKTLKIMHDLGYNFFIYDYRGYGKSEGSPTEKGTYADTRAALNFLLNEKKCTMDNVIFHARSLGGGIAAGIVAEKQPRVFILESTFTCIIDLAEKMYPFLPVKYLTKIKYPTIDNLKKVDCPILFIHSPDDEVIPFSHGKKLYETYQGPKSWLQLTGGHNDGIYRSEKEYIPALKKFLDTHLRDR